MRPGLFDVVKLMVDLPKHNLRRGAEGTIVECYPDNTYEVEFDNEHGETLALCALSGDQFKVVWQPESQTQPVES
jgi:hypothetical protein